MNINPKVVDIYHLDEVKNFDTAYAFGIRGVIHKASEGTSASDKLYAVRRPLALQAGMLWGAYHFIRPGNIDVQARRFVSLVTPDAGLDNTLLALDHEDEHVSLSSARAFMEAVEEMCGREMVLYSGFLIKEQIVKASDDDKAFFAERRLWLAQYGTKPTWPKQWKAPWLWQYTGDGDGPKPHAVPGIQDKMDINSFAGSDADLAAQWAGVS